MRRDWLPEDRALRIGLYVSGGAHLALILWALMGGIFFTPDPNPEALATSVSLMSAEEFAALDARAPTSPEDSPEQPAAPEASAAPPVRPEAEAPPEETPPVEAVEEPAPEAPPEIEEPVPTETEVTDAAPSETLSPAPDSLSQIPDEPTDAPQPDAAEIVAPEPTPDPPPEAQTSESAAEATTDAPADEPQEQEPSTDAVPRDTGEVLLTEENRDEETQSAAPSTAPVPPRRPEQPQEPAPEASTEVASAKPQPDAPAEEAAPAEDPLAAALEEAMAGEASDVPEAGTGTADQGPPMTDGEKDALVVAVKQCWNVGALSTDALNTIVTIAVSMGPDGKPDSGSIRMIGVEGGTEASAQQAFEAGRRAIIRCARNGYALPAEKYEQWKEIEITFDPNKMRLR
jgi:hypothetical protein